jgi:penicillin amidase
MRAHRERGYRLGWEPAQQWQSILPYDALPALHDPPQGRISTANNRVVADDYPYPLSGTWGEGYRARRIRQMLEAQAKFVPDDFVRLHTDVLSLRAVVGAPRLLTALDTADFTPDERTQRALAHLRAWDSRMEPDRIGATLFDVFFDVWKKVVAQERFAVELVQTMAGALSGLALALLAEDEHGWFQRTARSVAIRQAFTQTLDDLEKRLGADMEQWQWGRIHTLTLHHFLSGRGDLGQLLDRGGHSIGGNALTVCNAGTDATYQAVSGASFRLIADLSTSPPLLWSVDTAGQSGNPGDEHYCDQLIEWVNGRYHVVKLAHTAAEVSGKSSLILTAR